MCNNNGIRPEEYHGTGDKNPKKFREVLLMCGNNNGFCGCLNNNWWWIIILVLLFCNCGGNWGWNGCDNNNNCGCC